MSQIVSDDFHRADASNLGANWSPFSIFSSLTIISNQCNVHDASAINANLYTGAGWTGGADQYTELTVQAQIALNDGGPIARGSTGAETCYIADINDTDSVALGGSMTFDGYKLLAGAFTVIITGGSQVVSAGDVLRIETQGSTIRIFRNGVSKGSTTDSSISSGLPGIFGSANGGSADGSKFSLWAAGDFTSASSRRPFTAPVEVIIPEFHPSFRE